MSGTNPSDILRATAAVRAARTCDVPLTVNEDQLANITIVRKPKG